MPLRRTLALPLLAALVFSPLAGCSFKKATDEDRIRGVVQDIVVGAMSGDVGDVMAHVSHRYQADTVDYESLRGLLVEAFLRRGPIVVVPGPIEVKVTGDTAHASFSAAIAEGSGRWDDLVNADGWHLEVDFAREPPGDAEGDWLVVNHVRTSGGG